MKYKNTDVFIILLLWAVVELQIQWLLPERNYMFVAGIIGTTFYHLS